MNVFITGASGFVGGAVLKQLGNACAFRAMARSSSSAAVVRELGADPVDCSLDNVEASHLRGCDAVIHSAAFVGPWGTRKQYRDANVVGTERMLSAAAEAGVKRFVHIGTEAALFRGQHMRDIDESYPYPDNSPFLYSVTKKEAEIRVLEANAPGSGFETISLRPRLIWGPDDQTVLPELLKMVESGQFSWINHGKAVTSTAYIDNVVHAIGLALVQGKTGEAYFITDGEYITYKEFLTRLLNTQGVEPGNRSMPSWLVNALATLVEGAWRRSHLSSQPPLVRMAVAMMGRDCTLRIDKARQHLDYEPKVSIAEGMERMAF